MEIGKIYLKHGWLKLAWNLLILNVIQIAQGPIGYNVSDNIQHFVVNLSKRCTNYVHIKW